MGPRAASLMLLLIVKSSATETQGTFAFMSPTTDGEVRSRDELVSFVQELHRDFLRNGHEWESNPWQLP